MNKRSISILILSLFCIFLSVLETLAYKIGGIYSVAAGRIWIVMGFYYLFSSFHLIINQSLIDIKKRHFLGFIAVIIVCFISLSKVGSIGYLDHESTSQLADAFENIKEIDLRYTKTSFLGYPNRQYLITLLPSLLFGKNPLSLHLGYTFPFILGVLIFYTGLKKALKDDEYGNLFTSLAIVSIVLSPYVIEFLLHYEQAILPLSFTLQALGLFLISSESLSSTGAINLIWIGSLLSTSYTPGLGSWVLLLALISINIFKNLKVKHFVKVTPWACCFLVIIVFGINSLFTRDDLPFNLENRRETVLKDINTIDKVSIDRILEGYRLFFFSDPKSFFGPILFLPAIFYLITSLFALNGPIHIIIAVWVIFTAGISFYLKGYANPPPDLAIHRAMIVIPVIITGLVFTAGKNLTLNKNKAKTEIILYILFALMIVFSLQNLNQTIKTKQADIRTDLVADIINQSKLLKARNIQITNIILFSKITDTVSTGNLLRYFFPEFDFVQNTSCNTKSTLPGNSLLYFEDINCARRFFAVNSIKIIQGRFTYEYNNNRYKMTRAIYIK